MTGSIQTCNWKRHESSSLHTKNILQLITRRTWQADRCGFDEANGSLPKLLEESFVSSGRNNPLSGSAWTSDPWHRGNNWICLQWQLLGNYWIHFQIWSVSERTHQSHASKGKGHISYLSKTTIEELIQLLSDVVFKYIIRELKHYKMFLNNCWFHTWHYQYWSTDVHRSFAVYCQRVLWNFSSDSWTLGITDSWKFDAVIRSRRN